ncbi:MAG: radical SAM family heme chaperone HemW [Myxococcaceae bacterium]|jgi:putative oxygen-independent coproporphyrinogen III oxidase|nr:radical SAM family heme chaperone HemW [Myxococcaceae bacterium]
MTGARAPVDPWTALEAARFAIYVHFPYCLSKCPYCDFASTAAKQVPEARYARAVLRELDARLGGVAGREVQAVFFGGGTPSLWAPRHVEAVLQGLRARLPFSSGCEVTLEANPGAADAARFAGFRAAGINRLSLGVQSFDAGTLASLGRAHDGAAAVAAFRAARQAGFDNVSMDFIYGVHGQTVEQVRHDAEAAVALGSEHLSAYALTLDAESLAEEVPLARQLARGEVALPPDEVVVEMQRVVRDVYRGAGLARYEVSNYARPGAHSRHNAAYWTGGDWLALGVGATGSLGETRYANVRSAEKYLVEVEAGRLPERSREALRALERFEERVAMGLRLTTGLDLEAVCEAFGEPYARRRPVVEALVAGGLAVVEGRRLRLTDEGLDVHSSISARLI